MKINRMGFKGIETVSIGHCTYAEAEKDKNKIKNDSVKAAREQLEQESKKYTEKGIPHTLFTTVHYDRFDRAVDEVKKTGHMASASSDCFKKPLVEVYHHIATGEEHEALDKVNSLKKWFKNFKPNLIENDPRSLTFMFSTEGAIKKLDNFKTHLELYLVEYAKKIHK